MTDDRSTPSETACPIISELTDQLRRAMPASEVEKLLAYDSQIAASKQTKNIELRRALACAHWALRLVGQPEHGHFGHLITEAREIVEESYQTIRAAGTAAASARYALPASARLMARAAWVDEAVRVAKAVAQQSGWQEVPWEDLLQELLAIRQNGDAAIGAAQNAAEPEKPSRA
jgi:hypothetical protein